MYTNNQALEFIDLGLCDYATALEKQRFYHEKCLTSKIKGVILKTEHPNVITLGKNASYKDLLFDKEFYVKQGIEIFETQRGGYVTVHMPGQLVVYPILKILEFNLFPKTYVQMLEKVVIQSLEYFGIQANTIKGNPGVWVNNKKICSIGIRIAKRISMHGLALNVSNSLDLFKLIVPCGMSTVVLTSMSRELQQNIKVNDVWDVLKQKFLELICH